VISNNPVIAQLIKTAATPYLIRANTGKLKNGFLLL